MISPRITSVSSCSSSPVNGSSAWNSFRHPWISPTIMVFAMDIFPFCPFCRRLRAFAAFLMEISIAQQKDIRYCFLLKPQAVWHRKDHSAAHLRVPALEERYQHNIQAAFVYWINSVCWHFPSFALGRSIHAVYKGADEYEK